MLLITSYLVTICSASNAEEATFYSYDALGRLVTVSNGGGPRAGQQANSTYDPAGNRFAYAIGQPVPTPVNGAVFSISGPAPINEGEQSVFTVSKIGPAFSSLSVNYATVNNLAVAPGDFFATSGTLVFRSWETVKTVAVVTVIDSVGENAESFTMQLSSPTQGSSIGTSSASATINANGAPNQPPVTTADTMPAVGVCQAGQKNVAANDTDPEGNYPLTVSAVGSSPLGEFSVINSTTISLAAFGTPGNSSVVYTIRDSLGASSTGIIYFSVVNGQGCN